MIDTRHLDALPPPARLRDLCRALSVLEEIVEPRWDLRFVLHDAGWAPQQELTTLQTGGRARAFVWFTPAGVVIAGTGENARSRGVALFADLPAALAAASTEPAFEVETLSFAIWRLAGDDRWHAAPAAREDDGAEALLWLLDDAPATYVRFAREHHRRTLDEAQVAGIYARSPLTQRLVRSMNRDARALEVLSSAAALGYEVSAPASARHPLPLPLERPAFDPSGPAEASFTIGRNRGGTWLRVGERVETHPDRAVFEALYRRLVTSLHGDANDPPFDPTCAGDALPVLRAGRGLAFLERILIEDPRMRIVLVTSAEGGERITARDLAGGSITVSIDAQRSAHVTTSPSPPGPHAAELLRLRSMLGGDARAYVDDVRARVSLSLDLDDVERILAGKVDAPWIAALADEYVANDALATASALGLLDEGVLPGAVHDAPAVLDPEEVEVVVRRDADGVRIVAGRIVRAHAPRAALFADALEDTRRTLRAVTG